jgi:hypothetical protein
MKIFQDRNQLIAHLPKNMIIGEIGVFRGEFSEIILNTIEPKELHLIDIFTGIMCSGNKDGQNIIWIDLDESFSNLQQTYKNKPNVKLHKGRSLDVLSKFENNYFDMLYIDADHSYNGTLNDLLLAREKVKNNGIISGHDYTELMFPGVVAAVKDFCAMYSLTIDSLTQDGCPTFIMYNLK